MKIKILTLFLVLPFLNLSSDDFRCTCVFVENFCDHIQNDFVDVAVQVEVIDQVEYSQYNQAVYLKVLKKYKEDIPITDTIKLYSSFSETQPTSCDTGLDGFSIGEKYILPLSNTDGIVNPDSLLENYWETRINACTHMHQLKVQSGIVSGFFIIETVRRLTIEQREFQIDDFEERLITCEKIIKDKIVPCSVDNFVVTPNPATSFNQVKLKLKEDDISVNTIEKIRVLSVEGRVLEEFDGAEINPFREIELSQFNDGLNLIEIQCNGERFIKKVIIDK